jgi:hypothetical protein
VDGQCDALWEGRVVQKIAGLELLELAKASYPAPVQQAPGYFRHHQARMDDPTYRRDGYPIGSGTVESGANTLIHHRLRRPGPGWTCPGANAMLAGLSKLYGRKSRSQRFDGFKRHVLRDLDREVVLGELHLDRAYLTYHGVRERQATPAIYCKAWPVRNHRGFPKTAFALDWDEQTLCCPNEVVIPVAVGHIVRFPAETCTVCPLRERCTGSEHGRSVKIHPDERLLAELRERAKVEHALAHVGRWQGERARYLGRRKNLFDLRRAVVVFNLHVLAHSEDHAQAA